MNGPVVLRVVGSTMEGLFDRSMYLVEWDVDKFDGFGYARLSYDVDEAHRFVDAMEAMTTWRTPSTVRPYRVHDGRPNKPLTAYTVEVVPLAAAKAEDAQ